MFKVKNILIGSVLFVLAYSVPGYSAKVNIKDRMDTRDYILGENGESGIFFQVFGRAKPKPPVEADIRYDFVTLPRKELTVTKHFTKAILDNNKKKGKKRKLTDAQRRDLEIIDKAFPQRIAMPIYYWLKVEPNLENLSATLRYYGLYRLLILRDYIDDPLTTQLQKDAALAVLRELVGDQSVTTQNLFRKSIGKISKMASKFNLKMTAEFLVKKIQRTGFELFGRDFVSEMRAKAGMEQFPDYSLSWLGYIPGNQVEIVSKNDRSDERVKWFNDRPVWDAKKRISFYPPYMKMPSREFVDSVAAAHQKRLEYNKNKTNKPTDAEDNLANKLVSISESKSTYKEEDGHIVFVQDPVYKRIRDMIDRAQESIFIDIFLFGGTLGGTLAKYLFEQAIEKRKSNPNFRVLLIHDYATNYNMWPEMGPVFMYMRDFLTGVADIYNTVLPEGEQGPDRRDFIHLMQSNIQRHSAGVPLGLTDLIPKKEAVFREMEKQATYYESKIDHSKVIVIDAATDRAEAYFGSKNWTDHSGGYYFDDAIWVKGTGAALVQYSYYGDIVAALTEDKDEQRWFYYKDKGFDNTHYANNPKLRQTILDWMVKGIRERGTAYEAVGSSTMRIAEANVDGRVKNVRNILIDMISKAEEYIYLEQLFCYDPYINDAIIKRILQKGQNPDGSWKLKVKLLADHNRNFGFNGLPNTTDLRELAEYGVEIRAISTSDIRAEKIRVPSPDGKAGETIGRMFHQENHKKVTVVDGKVLVGGSSNQNPDTFQGSFREFGAQIFDENTIKDYVARFEASWEGADSWTDHKGYVHSHATLTEEFPVVSDWRNFHLTVGKTSLPWNLSHIVNAVAATLFRNKDYLESRP